LKNFENSLPDRKYIGEKMEINKPVFYLLFGLLAVYTTLFLVSGYFVFQLPYSLSTDPDHIKRVVEIEDEKAKEAFLKGIEQMRPVEEERNKMAIQSFNVILGAFLGYLSAVAVAIVGAKLSTTKINEDTNYQSQNLGVKNDQPA
jgi:hypothetical protein